MLDDPLLTDAEAAGLARLTKDKLAKLRVNGEGPPFIKIGRKVLYRRGAVKAWLGSLERDHVGRRVAGKGDADVG